jgi:TonB family protein
MRTVNRFALIALLLAGMPTALCAQAPDARETMNLGVAAFRASNLAAAVEYFERARQMDPSLTAADLYLASTFAQMYVPRVQTAQNQEFAKKAIALFEGYLAKQPADESALKGLAGILQNSEDLPKAREIYIRLTRVVPQNPVNFYSIAAIDWLLAYGKSQLLPSERSWLVAEGLENVDIAIRLNPQYEDAIIYKNLLLREKARLTSDPVAAAKLQDEANQWFNKALEIRRQNPPAVAPSTTLLHGGGVPLPPPPPPPPQRIGSGAVQLNLISSPKPQYPERARAARVQDYVMMQATIDKTGAVVDLKVLRGHPLLNDAAIEAVRQWRYKPILLNGEPIDVITTITTNFSLQ